MCMYEIDGLFLEAAAIFDEIVMPDEARRCRNFCRQ